MFLGELVFFSSILHQDIAFLLLTSVPHYSEELEFQMKDHIGDTPVMVCH